MRRFGPLLDDVGVTTGTGFGSDRLVHYKTRIFSISLFSFSG